MIGLSFALAVMMSVSPITLTPDLPTAYKMEISLDTTSHTLSGSESVSFLNPTSDTLTEISFHLFPNAFSDTNTIFANESSEIRRAISSGNISKLEISNIVIDGMPIDSSRNRETGSLYYIPLPNRLPPGDSISISLNFRLKIPRVNIRFGYDEYGNYLLSHCLPILCGYQKGKLVDFEYHAQSEFFSNFASYDVRLDLPAGFAVGSTGVLQEVSRDSSRVIWQARADTVIDFAFAGGPAFEVTEKDTLEIKIRYLIRKEHTAYLNQTDWITKFSLGYNSGRFFKYPYPVLTLVDFDLGAQGMELPGMVVITFPSEKYRSMGKAMVNLAISHEVTHQWFYGIIASNEAEEPWLDEGVTSYVTSRLLESGDDSLSEFSIFGYKISLDFPQQIAALMTEAEWPVEAKSWDYPDEFNYSATVYFKAELVLKTLESYLGRAVLDSAMSHYANSYRFRHPDTDDFKQSLSASCGINLDRYFEQFVSGSARLDYSLRSLKYAPAEDSTKGKYKIDMIVIREYDGIVPQRISVALENGTAIDTVWDGSQKVGSIALYSNSRPLSAVLTEYALDENKANNSIYLNSFSSRIMSFEWDMISIMELLLAYFL
jgi:hypothetical protein